VYFNVRGVCEVARYMLHMCSADYEDFRYLIDTSTFKKVVEIFYLRPFSCGPSMSCESCAFEPLSISPIKGCNKHFGLAIKGAGGYCCSVHMPMKLVYFNGRGVCEVARYMLHMSGVDYEDHRYPINHTTFEKKVWCQLTFPA